MTLRPTQVAALLLVAGLAASCINETTHRSQAGDQTPEGLLAQLNKGDLDPEGFCALVNLVCGSATFQSAPECVTLEDYCTSATVTGDSGSGTYTVDSGTTAPSKYEAEDAQLTGGAKVMDDHAGWGPGSPPVSTSQAPW